MNPGKEHTSNRTQVKSPEFCHKDEFQCQNVSECIPSSYRCDGKFDCFDKSDEQNCTGVQKNTTEELDLECQWPAKQCVDIKTNLSICLEIERFCNHHVDCVNGTDEGGLCDHDLCFNR